MTSLPTFKDLPAFTASDMANPAGMVTKLQRVVETLQLIIGTRGPGRGNTAWFQSLVDAGLLDGGGNVIPKPPGSGDTTPPPVPSGLTVSPGINHIFVEWDAATYAQGGGNALSIIYGATYDPVAGGPLPTFANAVPIATVPFSTQIYAHPTEPNVQWHIWVSFVTYADKEGNPAGGLNGVQATSGKIDGAQHIEALTVTRALIADLAVDNGKVANLSASKLITGTIAVGETISSSGFVSGFSGFSINGAGNAEFNNAIFRGTGVFGGQIVATSGSIGGALIGSNYVQSDNYNGVTAGWRLDNDLGKLFAKAGEIAAFTIDGKVLKLGTAALDASGDGIAMGKDTDGLNKLYVGNSTHGIHFDGADFYLIGDVVDTNNVVADGITKTWGVTYTTSTGTGSGHQTGVNGTFTAGSKITLFSGGEVRGPGSGTATLQLQRYEGHDDTNKINLTVLFGPIDVDYGGVFLFPPYVDTLTTAGAYTYEIWKTSGPGLRNRSIVLQEFKR